MSFKSLIKSSAFITSVSVVGVCGASAGIGVGIYYGIQASKSGSQGSNDAITIDSNVTDQKLKQFSQNNSFRIQLQTSDINEQGKIEISEGTAWSWYYTNDTNSPIYEWYLLTNFHVVASTLAYVNQNNPLLGEFNNNRSIFTIGSNLYIDLEFYNGNINDNHCQNQDKYTSIVRQSNGSATIPLFSKAQIISDNQINNFDLFSANENNPMQNYNLDMAIVKFEFNKSVVNQFLSWNNNYSFSPQNVANPYGNYLKENGNKIIGFVGEQLIINTNNIKVGDEIKWEYKIANSSDPWQLTDAIIQDPSNPNLWILTPTKIGSYQLKIIVNGIESNPISFNIYSSFYIAGNPGICNRLVFSQVDCNSFEKSCAQYPVNNSFPEINQPIYLHTMNISNWNLTAGASGSAVYTINFQNDDLLNSYPFGVYWGGYGSDNSFKPAFTPLISNGFICKDFNSYSYNIYDNFTNCLNILASQS